MPTVSISLDVDLVLEVMVLSGIRNTQDAIEVVVRDYIERGHRTEELTGDGTTTPRSPEPPPREPAG